MSKRMLGNLLLIGAALIWGFAFAAQSLGLDIVPPLTFGGVRNGLGSLALLPVIFVMGRSKKNVKTAESRKYTWIGGLCCGLALFVASTLQQFGIAYTTAGKASFITTLYIVIVPLFSLFLGKKIGLSSWIAVLVGMAGLYLICITESFSIGKGDLLVLLCAPCFSVHILLADYFVARGDGVKISCIQLAVVFCLSLPLMLIFEDAALSDLWACRWPLLYAGVGSCGVAYTLQILGQKHTESTTASLLMSLESVFGALGGWLVLGEIFTLKEFLGAALVFGAVILTQLPSKKEKAIAQE